MDGACTRAEGEALAELRNAPRTPVPLSLSLDRRRIAREEEEEEESARGSSEGEERRRRSEIEWSSGGEGWCTVEGKRGMKRPSFCRVIRGLPRGICYPRERKSRDSRGFARAARLGSPIMSISNTTNCTQPNGECACVRVCVRAFRWWFVAWFASPSPCARARARTRCQQLVVVVACIGLLNSPASKIVLSFCLPARRALRRAQEHFITI